MKTVMGIINLQEENKLIRELTDRRAVESLPFAGRYRLIDFTSLHAVEFSYGEVKDDLLPANIDYLFADIFESDDMTLLLGHCPFIFSH